MRNIEAYPFASRDKSRALRVCARTRERDRERQRGREGERERGRERESARARARAREREREKLDAQDFASTGRPVLTLSMRH